MKRARDMQDRLIELQGMREAYLDNPYSEVDLDDDEQAELAALLEIDDLEYLATDNAVLIPESEFEDYARSYATELWGNELEASWPFNCIDWKQAANDLSSEFTVIEYAGESYYTRG